MNVSPLQTKQLSLKKVLGFSSLFVVAIGNVTSQSSFVSILNGAGQGGASFLIALLLAAILTLCYIFTYLELSLMMPKAGGPGTYTTVAMGNFPAIVLVLCGYIAVSAFSIPSELMLMKRVLETAFPGIYQHLGLVILILLTILNVLGIDIFSSVQNLIVYIMIVAILLLGFETFGTAQAQGIDAATFKKEILDTNFSVLSLMTLALWSFAGLEFVCPLIEESKRPEKDLPRAMLISFFLLIIFYGLIALAGMIQVPAADLASSDIPHWLLAQAYYGKAATFIIVVFAITTSSSTVNILLATTPRLFYGMAHHNQLPAILKKIHPRWDTPWFGILLFAALAAIPLLLFGEKGDVIIMLITSAASLWLVAYIISHINVLILRRRYKDFKRPFKTPLYPWPQIIGIIGMGYALWNNSPSAEIQKDVLINGAVIIGIAIIYGIFRVKYTMKKKLFDPVPIEQAIAD